MRKREVDILTVGNRLREERQRLGLSQMRLADATGVSKNTAINWEKDASSPTAAALLAFSELGADVLYVVTGRRTPDRGDEATANVSDHLAAIRRDLLVSAWEPHAGEDEAAAEARVLNIRADQLRGIMQGRAGPTTQEQIDETETLLSIATNPIQLAAFRAADHVQRRVKRRKMRDTIRAWTDLGDYQPTDDVINIMSTVALDYGVPIDLLVELIYEIVASDEAPPAADDPA